MKTHSELTDFEFEMLFKEGMFNPDLFNHEAHLRLAWIHIKVYGVNQAIIHVTGQLFKYVTLLGAETKYNKTLTVAAVKAVNHFINKSKSEKFEDFIIEFPRLKYNFRELMTFHYQTDIYSSETAKKEFLEPELLPFD